MVTRVLATCLLAGGLAAASVAYADDTQANSTATATATRGQNDKGVQRRIDTQLDRLSKKVELTNDQKDQLRSQLQKSNQKTQKLWQQFANAHVQVIKLEAEMTAALEDVLAPEQKSQTQQNRHAKAGGDADNSGSTKGSVKESGTTAAARSTEKPTESDTARKRSGSDSAATSSNDGSSRMKKSRDSSKTANQNRSANGDNASNQDEMDEYVWTMVIVPAQQELNPLGLSADQAQQADQIFSSYHNKIVKRWQKIDQLHDQLVAMEAQSILDVESVLTKDQRQKLMDMRKKSNAGKKDSNQSKSEDED